MCKTVLTAVVGGLLAGLVGQPAMAQTDGTIEVQRVAVVNENPRGDSVVLDTLPPGTVLGIVEVQSPWYLVQAPDGVTEWRRGWIHERYLTVLSMPTPDPDDADTRVPLRTTVRGFGGQPQLVDATNRLNTSDGFIQPNVYRGRLLS